jgi:MYXO-CTERM domain-containing protein
MTEPNMTRQSLVLSVLSAFVVAAFAPWTLPLAATAHAQTAYSSITEVRIDGKKKPVGTPVFINSEECKGSFVFKLTPLGTTISVMEAWVTNQAANCSLATERSTVNNNQPNCWKAGSESGVTGEFKFPLEGAHIFVKDGFRNGATECSGEVINQMFKIYFVPLASSSESAGSTAPQPILGAIVPSAEFTLFTERPDPPAEVKAYPGKRELRVTWKRTETNALTRFRAFFDYGPAAPNQECGSGALERSAGDVRDAGGMDAGVDGGVVVDEDDAGVSDAGEEQDVAEGDDGADTDQKIPPASDTPFVKIVDDIAGETARLRDLDDIPIGTKVSVAVSTIDPTGNIGYLSPRQCVVRTDAKDLADLCAESKDCGLGTCNVSPGRTGGAVGLTMFALALYALIRRRRSA